jgi:hypothetical protein
VKKRLETVDDLAVEAPEDFADAAIARRLQADVDDMR